VVAAASRRRRHFYLVKLVKKIIIVFIKKKKWRRVGGLDHTCLVCKQRGRRLRISPVAASIRSLSHLALKLFFRHRHDVTAGSRHSLDPPISFFTAVSMLSLLTNQIIDSIHLGQGQSESK